MTALILPNGRTVRRVRLSRAKGWRKPEGCIVVARPTRWGNPYRVGATQLRYPRVDGTPGWELEGRIGKTSGDRHAYYHADGRVTMHDVRDATVEECVALYREQITGEADMLQQRYVALLVDEVIESLAGHDLGCWRPLDSPCHADVLLHIANPDGVPVAEDA